MACEGHSWSKTLIGLRLDGTSPQSSCDHLLEQKQQDLVIIHALVGSNNKFTHTSSCVHLSLCCSTLLIAGLSFGALKYSIRLAILLLGFFKHTNLITKNFNLTVSSIDRDTAFSDIVKGVHLQVQRQSLKEW